MAIENCKECNKEISSRAEKCPHCGIKNPTTSGKDVMVGAIAVAAVIALLAKCAPVDSDSKAKILADAEIAKAEKLKADAKCKEDLQCTGDKAVVNAGAYCQGPLEKLGKYSSRWTTESLALRFSGFAWLNKERGTLRFQGDKIEYQNGFGAFRRHIYTCDFDPATNKVLGVSAKPGRL